jgi:hypothetical protein
MPEDLPDTGSVAKGVAIAIGLDIGLFVLVVLLYPLVLLACGVAQLLWLVPLYFYFRSAGKSESAKGVLIVAGLCFLLNAVCWGLVLVVR